MDELELAKRAIRRNLLSEEQLREAQDYAQGGRPLLAVLLDLGFLKPADLQALFSPAEAGAPTRRPSSRIAYLVAGGVIAGFAIFLGSQLWPPSALPRHPPPELPRPVIIRESPKVPPLCDQLAAIAGDHLADAERQLQETGSFTPQVRDRLARAAALYEEAIRERPKEVSYRLSLGRARELLDQWEIALQIFRQVVEAHPDHGPALVGAARCLLLLQRHEAALADADRACAAAPNAEAFLVRARALISLGRHPAARKDLLQAERLGAVIGPLLGKLKE